MLHFRRPGNRAADARYWVVVVVVVVVVVGVVAAIELAAVAAIAIGAGAGGGKEVVVVVVLVVLVVLVVVAVVVVVAAVVNVAAEIVHIHGKLGGHRLQEKKYLIPERGLCFLCDQASSLQDPELSEEVLLENVLCKSLLFHLPAWTASLLASHLYTATLQLSGRKNPNGGC